MMRRIYEAGLFMLLILLLAAIVSISGCTGGTDVGNPESSTFASDEALMAYLVDQYAESVLPTDRGIEKIDDNSQPRWDEGTQDTVGNGFSETNVQEAGVDESDKVKTDGTYIYAAGDREVRIVNATPPENMRFAGQIDINGFVDSLYLHDDTLVVLYTPDDGTGTHWPGDDDILPMKIGMPYWIPVNAKVGILITDVSDPENPLTIKDIQTDGYLVSSRVTGGNLHVITQYFPDIPPIELWYDGSEKDKTKTVDANKQILDDLTLDDFIPSYSIYDSDGVMTDSGRLVDTENFLAPDNPNGGTIVSITTLDLTDLTDLTRDFDSVGFISDVHHVYASPSTLYLVSSIYNYRFATDTATAAAMTESTYQTQIYQFDISTALVEYTAFGQIQGLILNQFSLGEYKKVLRIATTTGYVWDGSAKNHVYCMKQEGKKLNIIGRLENIEPGERLYAARFIGDRGFLVTFVEIDPLFTLDLSDPKNPIVAGELKVPGYSTYIHSLDSDHLLTIGKDAKVDDNNAWYQGVQMSIFDISDFSNPKLIHFEKIGDRGTESEALYNHKAFTFWPERNLLALPINLYEHLSPQENPWDYGTNTFTGLYVYDLSEELDFEYLGRIEMRSADVNFYGYQDWTRGIFIDDHVYAVNTDVIKTAEIHSIKTPFDSIELSQ